MVRENEIRENEVAAELPAPTDTGLIFIGHIETPRQGRPDGPLCRIEIFDPWDPA